MTWQSTRHGALEWPGATYVVRDVGGPAGREFDVSMIEGCDLQPGRIHVICAAMELIDRLDGDTDRAARAIGFLPGLDRDADDRHATATEGWDPVMSKPDHLLHYTLGAEGYGTARLECIHGPDVCQLFTERPAGPCRCIAAGNPDCEPCRDGDHGGCGYFGAYIEPIGYECQCDPQPGCWAQTWMAELGTELIHGDNWPEDGFPHPVRVDGGEYPEIHYCPPEDGRPPLTSPHDAERNGWR